MGFSQQNFGLLPLKSIVLSRHLIQKSKEQIGEAAAAASRFSPLFWYGSRLVVVRSREDYSAALLKHTDVRGTTHIHMLKSDPEKICIYVIEQHGAKYNSKIYIC